MSSGAPGNAPLVIPPVMRSFMLAQFANLFKFSLWWTSLSPLLFSMVNGDASIIGVGRVVYNVALCIFNPFGALLVERHHPRTILNVAAIIRFVIYVILVPLVWLLFDTNLIGAESTAAVYGCLAVFLFVDGVAVAGSVVLDIDMGGIDITAGRFGLEVTDDMRNYFNSMQELFFSICFIFFAPAMAFIGIGAKKIFSGYIDRGSVTVDQAESGTLVLIFVFGFLLASIVQWLFIARLRDPSESAAAGGGTTNPDLTERLNGMETATNSTADATRGDADDAAGGGGTTCGGILGDLKESFMTVIGNQPILFRLLFLGFEIAFEDAAIVVIASQMGLRCSWLGNGRSVDGNIWTAVAVACGKLGGALASILVMKCYAPPEEPRGYFALFVMTSLSTLVTCGFPLVNGAVEQGHLSDIGAEGIHLTLFFLYFFFSTLPKLGFMSLLQNLIAKVENGHRAFGFIAVIATTMDALIVMGLSAFFIDKDVSVTQALWYVAYCYMAHGVLELILGPLLVLRPMQKAIDDEENQKLEEARRIGATGGKPDDATGGDGPKAPTQYTQRSAAVPVENQPATTPRNAGDTLGVRTAVLSTSQPTPLAVAVTRRRSALDAENDEGLSTTPGGGGQPQARVGSYMRAGAMPKSPRSPRPFQ